MTYSSRLVAAVAAVLGVMATPSFGAGESARVQSVDVIGTAFHLTLADGTVLTGSAIVGGVVTIAAAGGTRSVIRIDAVESDPNDAEITLYELSFRDASGVWRNLCEPDAKGVRKGFPLRGAFDAELEYHPDAPGFTLTCTGGVQAKCVRWGYKPWHADVGGVRMVDLYRTCTRMARADYCGDGTGATRNGTQIDLYDVAAVQEPEPASTMRFEAAWGPDGAICVRHTRLPDVLSIDQLIARCPRLANAVGGSCGEDAPGALLFNKSK